MPKIIKTTFKLRRGTAEAWEKNNPILAYGEPGFDKDNYGIKIGDGVTPWKQLDFVGVSKEVVEQLINDYFEENPGAGSEGKPGKDGISATHSWNGTILTISSASGTSSADLIGPQGPQGEDGAQGPQGEKGLQGEQGEPGRGIASISRTSGNGAPGTNDIYTIIFTDNTSTTFTVHNGSNGSNGEKGEQGEQGEQGNQGEKGDKGDKGDDGFSPSVQIEEIDGGATITINDKNGATTTFIKNGEKGEQGIQGEPGVKGDKGDTGPKGETGENGAPGKSAYEYAKEAGYTKTESDFAQKLATENYTKNEVDDLITSSIAKANHLQRTIVQNSLSIDPNAEGAENFIYMVPKSDSLTEDYYDEFMVIDGKVEKVGDWAVDLSEYATEEYVDDKIAEIEFPDAIPVPMTAEIGQTIVIKSVDANGKPTEWEATDFPTGEEHEVQFIEQILTHEQQMQARANLGLYNNKQTFLDKKEVTLTDGTGYVWFDNLKSGDIRVVIEYNTSEPERAFSIDLLAYASYMGNPVYDWVFWGSDVRNSVEYNYGELIVHSAYEIYDGIYTISVYSLRIEQVPDEFIPDTIARTKDIESTYALKTEIPTVPVQSVNNKTGAVTLTASDVDARPSTWIPSASEVGALPDSTVIPTKVSELENDVGYWSEKDKQYIINEISSALPTIYVSSLVPTQSEGKNGDLWFRVY